MRPVLLLACLFATAAPAAPRLSVPAGLSAPTPAPIVVDGVAPGATVTVTTERRARGGSETFVGEATFIADAAGRVDTATLSPRGGSYAGVDPLGPFWSARPRAARTTDSSAGQIRVTASVGGAPVATALVAVRPDLARVLVSRDTPFPGAVWARPAAPGRHPVVIVLGGSEGGSSTARDIAPLFAARGYAALGLPYYDPGYDPTDRVAGLPRSFTNIPVDRLAAVRAWLRARGDANADRIAIWGASKGAEFALIAASRYRWVRAVVAVVPSDLVWEGWGQPGPATASFAFAGKPLASQPYDGMATELAKAAKGEPMDLRRVHLAGRAAYPERVAAARIPVERFRGALLLIAGGRDQIWPSAEMARNIVATRRRAGLDTATVIEDGANHFLGGPGTEPVAPLLTPGSNGAAIARARAEGWRATFDLLARTVGGGVRSSASAPSLRPPAPPLSRWRPSASPHGRLHGGG